MPQAIERTPLERLIQRDRTITLLTLASGAVLAWGYILSGGGIGMSDMDMSTMPGMTTMPEWTSAYFALMLAMWAVMMVAMMLPSAAPMILLFATIERRRRLASPLLPALVFAAAYVVVWAAFSVGAVLLQWWLDRLALLSPEIAVANRLLAGAVLIAAGIYQFTPLKQACLRACRSPLEFISRYWKEGPFGIGLRHGIYCVGCCWMLMALLFVGGVMNLVWVAVLAAFVLVEKTVAGGRWVGYALGAVLVVWGGWTIALASRGL